MFERRFFLKMATISVSGFLPFSDWHAAQHGKSFESLAAFGRLNGPDQNGVILPQGFRSRIVARSGEAPVSSSNYIWHPAPDGGACYGTEDGGWIYVSNSEMRGGKGGVGALRFNSAGEKIDSYSILENTTLNCAGVRLPGELGFLARNLIVGKFLNVILTEKRRHR